MAIDESKIQRAPPVQITFVDPNTGHPADGELFFFKAGTSTPKNAYIYSGDPQNPYVAVTTLPLTGAGSPNVQLFLYLLDEVDNVTPQLYRIAVTNALGSEIFTKDDFAFGLGSSILPPSSSDVATNLLAGYGFESKVFPVVYGEKGLPKPANGKFFFSLGNFLDIATTNAAELNTYSFTALNDSTIIGNPQNSITIKSTTNSSGDTKKQFGWFIGSYSSFQGVQLIFSVQIQKINGIFTTIPMKVIRENSISGIPDVINAGTLTVTGSLTPQTVTFTVPAIVASQHNNVDRLSFVFDLPLNEDFEVLMTATWLQESPDGLVLITEGNTGRKSAEQILGKSDFLYGDTYSTDVSGQRAIYTPSGLGVEYATGEIFQSFALPPNGNYAIMDDTVELLRDTIFEDSSTNRFIDIAVTNNALQYSTKTFACIVPVATSTVQVKTRRGTTHLRPASATAGGRITHALTQSEFDMGVEASISQQVALNGDNSINYNEIKFTWRTNGAVTTGMYIPRQGTGVYTWVLVEGGTTPILANYLGGVTAQDVGGIVDAYFWLPNAVSAPNVQGTASTPAEFSFYTRSGLNAVRLPGNSPYSLTIQDDGGNQFYNLGSHQVDVAAGAAPVPYNLGYLAWQDSSSFLGPIVSDGGVDGLYKHVLGFNMINGGLYVPTAAPGGVRRLVTVEPFYQEYDLAVSILDSVNNPRVDTFTIVSTPQTGDYLLIDNGSTRFQVIYFETGQPKPTPIAGEVPIYVEFTAAQSTALISAFTAVGINRAVAGVPDSAVLGLVSNNRNDIKYYVRV